MMCTQDLCAEDGSNRMMDGFYTKYISDMNGIASCMTSSSMATMKSCWIVLILETRNHRTAVLHPRCPTPHPLDTSDAIEDMMKPVTSKRLVFECQFAIHTRTTWTQRAC